MSQLSGPDQITDFILNARMGKITLTWNSISLINSKAVIDFRCSVSNLEFELLKEGFLCSCHYASGGFYIKNF
jgi:hypothetical protein